MLVQQVLYPPISQASTQRFFSFFCVSYLSDSRCWKWLKLVALWGPLSSKLSSSILPTVPVLDCNTIVFAFLNVQFPSWNSSFCPQCEGKCVRGMPATPWSAFEASHLHTMSPSLFNLDLLQGHSMAGEPSTPLSSAQHCLVRMIPAVSFLSSPGCLLGSLASPCVH